MPLATGCGVSLASNVWRGVGLLSWMLRQTLAFLQVPPGNRLEPLKGDRRGSYSIRINDQWRLCFRFAGGHAYDVEIVDYH